MTENKCQDLGDLEEIVTLNPDDEILCNRNNVDNNGNYVGGAVVMTVSDFKKNLNNISSYNKQNSNETTQKKSINYRQFSHNNKTNKITDADGEDITDNSFIESLADISEASLRMMCVGSSTEDSNIHFLTLNWEEIKVAFQQITLSIVAPLSTQIDDLTTQVKELSDSLDNAKLDIDDLQTQINDLKTRVDIIEPQTQENTLNLQILNDETSKIVVSMSYSDIINNKNNN